MPKDPLTVVGEIVERLHALQERYNLFKGAIFRAVVQRRDVEDPYLMARGDQTSNQKMSHINVLAGIRFSRAARSDEKEFSLHPFLEPDLHLLEAYLELDSIRAFLEGIAHNGRYGFGSGQDQIAVQLGTGNRAAEFGEPGLLHRREFEYRFGEPWPGVYYFLNTWRGLEEFQVSPEAAYRLGFPNMAQALWSYVLNPSEEGSGSPLINNTGILVIFPNYHARLSSAVIEGRKVRIDAEIAKDIPLEDLRLVLQSQGWIGESGFLIPWPKTWDSLPSRRLEYTFASAPYSFTARLYWNPGRNDAERFVDLAYGRRVEALYPQLAVWEHFDERLQKLEAALKGEGGLVNPQKDFEWAIASLLGISGFEVDWLGYIGGKKSAKKPKTRSTEPWASDKMDKGEIDVIAYYPRGRLAVLGECTLTGGDIDKKISGLSERATDLAEILQGWNVKKVLFTTLGNAGIQPSHEEAAKQLDIVLATRQVLDDLLGAVKVAVPAELLWQRLTPHLHRSPNLSS